MNKNVCWMAFVLSCGVSIDSMHAKDTSTGPGTNHFMNEPSFRTEMMNYYIDQYMQNVDSELKAKISADLLKSELEEVFKAFIDTPKKFTDGLDAAIERYQKSLSNVGVRGGNNPSGMDHKTLARLAIGRLLFVKMLQSKKAKDTFVAYYQAKYMQGDEYQRQLDVYKKSNNITGNGDPMLEDLNTAVEVLLHLQSN